MTDKCPQCAKWYLVYEVGMAVCMNPDCDFTEEMSRKDYLTRYADRGRMVVFPEELGGGLNPEWRGLIKRYA